MESCSEYLSTVFNFPIFSYLPQNFDSSILPPFSLEKKSRYLQTYDLEGLSQFCQKSAKAWGPTNWKSVGAWIKRIAGDTVRYMYNCY